MAFPMPPPPKSLLAHHRQLAPSAAVRVSPICLGGMSIGTEWESFMGSCDKSTSYEILDYFKSQGGNFIDTASNYQNEQSEMWIGDWMQERGNRDEMVIGTKFTTGWQAYKGYDKVMQGNFGGNHAKSMRLSVEASLKKLKTDYIDLLWVHWWDYSTSIPELMHALNDLVVNGKVIYLGISDTPAWVVAKANEYARGHNLRPFVVYQGRWSAAERDFEREIIPMCRAEGMGLCPWNALGGGNFKTQAQRDEMAKGAEGRRLFPATEAQLKVSEALDRVAQRKNASGGSDISMIGIALAYLFSKFPYVNPVLGCRKVQHLKSNIEALSIQLSPEEIKEIEGAAPFDLGFPQNFLLLSDGQTLGHEVGPADIFMTKMLGHFDFADVEGGRPVGGAAKDQQQ